MLGAIASIAKGAAGSLMGGATEAPSSGGGNMEVAMPTAQTGESLDMTKHSKSGFMSDIGGATSKLLGSATSKYASSKLDETLNGTSGEQYKRFMDDAFPNTTTNERLGSGAGSAASVSTAEKVAHINTKSAQKIASMNINANKPLVQAKARQATQVADVTESVAPLLIEGLKGSRQAMETAAGKLGTTTVDVQNFLQDVKAKKKPLLDKASDQGAKYIGDFFDIKRAWENWQQRKHQERKNKQWVDGPYLYDSQKKKRVSN